MGAIRVNLSGRYRCYIWRSLAGACLALLLMSSSITFAQGVEDKLKVAYLVNLVNFVKWPGEPNTVAFCVSASSDLYPSLKKLNQYVLDKGKTLVLMVNPASMNQCHMAFSDDASENNYTQMVLSAKPDVLTISDTSRALHKGYAFQLFVRNLHLRFAINRDAVDKAKYKISSKLLRLSRQVD